MKDFGFKKGEIIPKDDLMKICPLYILLRNILVNSRDQYDIIY